MKKLVIGILAHVDAGKTTLSEALLYLSGCISRLGRVDHGDAFLDTDQLERARGITIFSKQAVLSLPQASFTLLDTPGHVDFSTEMERALQVLDYAILVISGTDGVQSHTETLWRLLKRYRIPTFLFINKMDLAGADRVRLLQELALRLDNHCVDFSAFSDEKERCEQIALCDEGLLERYLASGRISDEDISVLITQRKLFPCWFGSALKLDGVEAFLQGMLRWTCAQHFFDGFAAKVCRIARDNQGARLTYLKITGGTLRVKDALRGGAAASPWEEKVDQIRVYSGAKYQTVDVADAGMLCAVTGLTNTRPGEGLGLEASSEAPLLEPVLTYQIHLPPECSVPVALRQLSQLEDEDPQLHIVWEERLQELHVQLMGQVQLEVLKQRILARFGMDVAFGTGNVVYKETIRSAVMGLGHFEPLRHYAEVLLLLEPGERGSGLIFDSSCSTDRLNGSWQRLILSHLEEKIPVGPLTGSPVTDLKITLLDGKASVKHTEGGDFRQATYRAVRQALRSAETQLLEPYYQFRLTLPPECAGRAMTDIQRMNGVCASPERENDHVLLIGKAPVAAMRDYTAEVLSYSKGRGRLSVEVLGYDACHNPDEVISRISYDCDADQENTADSVYCAHGAGYLVPWQQIAAELRQRQKEPISHAAPQSDEKKEAPVSTAYAGTMEEDKELQAIYERTYGAVRNKAFIPAQSKVFFDEPGARAAHTTASLPEYLLVDGYNIIFAWEELSKLAAESIDAARQSLIDILCNYQGYRKCGLVLVFDAYKVHGNPGSIEKYRNINIVYTKEAQTADMYIEKATYDISGQYRVRVATSDGMIQLIILGHGAQRVSADAFHKEVQQTHTEISQIVQRYHWKALRNPAMQQALEKSGARTTPTTGIRKPK